MLLKTLRKKPTGIRGALACLALLAAACPTTDTSGPTADIGGAVVLTFPLAGMTARTAPISSVFDHSMAGAYQKDSKVIAFNGAVGASNPVSDCYGQPGSA